MRFLLVSSLLLTTPLLAQRVLEVEPNNTAATAQAVAMGVQIDAEVSAAGDLDWYSFVTTGGQIRFSISGTLDTTLILWDATGLVTLAASDDARGLQSDITINLAAGSYYIQAQHFSATLTGLYSLDISFEHAPKPFTQAEFEPNDLLATANVLVPSGNSVQVDGNLSGALDVDFYQLVLTAPRTGLFFQVTEGTAPWISGHRIEFQDVLGVPIGVTLGTAAVDSSATTYRTATTRVWPAGTYHVVIKNRSAAPAPNYVPFGNYRLEIGIMPMNTGVPVLENAEPNSTMATATPLAPGAQGSGSITNTTGADTSDWWGPFTVGPSGACSVLTIQVAPGLVGGIVDSTLRLWQQPYPVAVPLPGGTPLLALTATGINVLDGGAASLNERTIVTFFVPGFQYWIEVLSPGAAATQGGSYLLEWSSNEPAMYVAGSYATLAVNAACVPAPIPTLRRAVRNPTTLVETAITNEAPTTGQTFVRQATNLNQSGLGLLIQGTDNIVPVDIQPLGLSTGALGTCFLNVNPLVLTTVLSIAPLGAPVDLVLNVPPTIALKGAIIWEQLAEVTSFTPFNIQMGNVGRILVGERSY